MDTKKEPEVADKAGRPTCNTCRSYAPTIPLSDEQGECRRMTPRADGDGVGRWPQISGSDWCSQHKPMDPPRKSPGSEYHPRDLLAYFATSLDQARKEDNYHVIERAEEATGRQYGPYHVNIAKGYLHKRGLLTKKSGKYYRDAAEAKVVAAKARESSQSRGPEPSYDIDDDIIPHYPLGEANAEPISAIARRIAAQGKASESAVYRCRQELLDLEIIARRDDGAYYKIDYGESDDDLPDIEK